MAKNINVKLTFSADTKAAQQQMAQLQQTLNNIAATPIKNSGLKGTTADIQAAANKAIELKIALQNATNVNTGKLNFTKFSQELKKNKTSLQDYAMHLQKLGPQGVQAFSQLASSIRQSETPLVNLQGKMAALGQTFMNTVKWSISSSLIQGVTRAFTSTIDYAKELNKSLTDIRIVTGKSVQDVSRFAVEANKAAKALSATTDEYAKASLIYFQQGLNDSAVAERTETTLKLAKVVGEEASTVSEWMTAIWNNFDDGSRSLENYADVLAKLGAATASSADEIAGGLEKFAAVAETVGLSYEYAASALATITAETRQSEDVVGTALKTIFARVESLKLGETLDDGTTLGKYSEALEKVGVNIKDSNGQLKEMDTILNDIGTTWGVLNRDQQVALAQEVAGIRQYSQFMALMDNWDVMEENVGLAKEANGALSEQHDIWETGIEGATSRVKEELNEIKNSLLGENDLLPLLNVAEGFLDFIGDLVDSLGGLPGLLSIVASVGLKIWGPQAAAGLQNMVSGIKSMYSVATGTAQADRSNAIMESAGLEAKMFTDSGMGNEEATTMSKFSKDNAARVIATEEAQGQLNSAYKETLHLLEQIIQKRQEEAQLAAQNADKAATELERAQDDLEIYGTKATRTDPKTGNQIEYTDIDLKDKKGKKTGTITSTQLSTELEKAGSYDVDLEDLETKGQRTGTLKKKAADVMSTAEKSIKGGPVNKEQEKALDEMKRKYEALTKAIREHEAALKRGDGSSKKTAATLKKATKEFKSAGKQVKTAENAVTKYAKATGISEEALGKVTTASGKKARALKEEKKATDEAKQSQDNYNEKLKEGKDAGKDWTTTFISGMQGLASGAAGLQMLTGAFDNLTTSIADGTVGFSEILSAITSTLFALPMLVQGLGTVTKALKLNVVWEKLLARIKKVSDAAEDKYLDKRLARNAKEKVSDSSSILVKWAKMLVDWPVGTLTALAIAVPIMAIIGGGIAALGAISVQNKKEEKQSEEADNKAIETAEGAFEVAEGWTEESQAMDELIAKHNQLKEANDQTIEGQNALKEAQQAIIDQVPKLIEKYKELDKEYEDLDLTGDIALLEGAAANKDAEQIEQITNDIDEKIAQETSELAKEGQSGAMDRTAAAMAGIQGKVKDNKYTVHVGGKGSYVEGLLEESTLSENGNRINIRTDDSKNFLEDYEKLQEIAKKAEETGHTGDDAYREIKEILDGSKEQYEKLKELTEEGKAYELQAKANEIGFDPSNISTYAEYVNEKERLVEAAVSAGIATKEEAAAWVEANKALSEYASVEKRALAYGDKYGQGFANQIKDYAKTLNNEEDLTAFLKIDFDKFQVKERWSELVEYIKQVEKADKLQAEVTAITSAEKNLKSNGTAKDYKKLQENMAWGKNGLIEYSEFLSNSYGWQKAYLEDIKIEKSKAAEEEYQASLKQLELTKLNYETQLKEAELRGDVVAQSNLLNDLKNLEEKIEATKISIELAKLEAKQAKEAQAQRIRDFKNSKKAYEDEYDAYHHIDEISEDLASTMEKIADAKEAAYGSDFIAFLNQEIRGLEIENELLDKTIELANKRAAAHKAELQTNYGATFDDFGNISNYNEIQGKYLQELASIEASQGKDSEAYKNKKQLYDDFIDLAEDYNEDLEKSEEATQEKASNMREILDKKLEGIEYEINIKIEVDDHYLNILERQLKRLDDDAYDGAERIVNYGQQASKIYNKQQTNANGIQRVLRESGVSEADIESYMQGNGDVVAKYNLSANSIEALNSYTEGFIESQEQFEELSDIVGEEVMTVFTAWRENIDDVGASIEAQGNLIKNYKNIVDILGKDKFGINDATLKALEEANNAAAQASFNNTRAQKEATENALAEAQSRKSLYEVGSEEYEYWAEIEKELSKQLEEDTANFMSSWENALTVAYETFESETKRAIENLSDFMAGINFDSMDELSKSFEWQTKASDRYLENYEKAYKLSKLNRKIQKDIDSTDNVKAQKVLRDMQKEIAEKQADGVELSKHDLEILQKKYDLKLAEIAMEEAQSAKSVVRLQRDSEGNFGYVYTSDQSAVNNAEQNYEDKLYAMQKSNDDYIESISEKIISNRKAMEKEIEAIDVTSYASKEEYLAAVEDITRKYQEEENYLLGEIQKTITSNQDIYNNDVLAYGSFVGQRGEVDKAWVTNFGDTTFAIATGFTSVKDAQTNLNIAIGDPDQGTGLLGALSTAYENLDKNVNTTMGTAGTSVTNFGDTVKIALYGEDGESGAIGNIKDLDDKTKEYETTAKEKFGIVATEVEKWYKRYGPKVQQGKQDVDALEESIAKLKSKEITIDTEVNGEDQVKALTEAIGKVKEAIEALQNTDFKITANVTVHTGGSSGGGGEEPPPTRTKDVLVGQRKTVFGTEYIQSAHDGLWYTSASAKDHTVDSYGQTTYHFAEGTQGIKELPTKTLSIGTVLSTADIAGEIDTAGSASGEPTTTYNSRLTFDQNASSFNFKLEKSTDKWGYKYVKLRPLNKEEEFYNTKNELYSETATGNANKQKLKAPWVGYYDLLRLLNATNPNNQYTSTFDTGGYTGSWGPEGRLAMLHQKEIVLNAHDTENFLAAIGIVRDISDQIEKNAIAMQYQNQFAAYRGNINTSGDTLQQEVHITAEFPNATNHSEIEEAFRNLTNLASQYANRKF